MEPPTSTQYSIENGQVIVPDNAAERAGLQPTVNLSVAGGDRIEVSVGEQVSFVAEAATPAGGGTLILSEWDFEGNGDYAEGEGFAAGEGPVSTSFTATHAYDAPGTYFVSLRVTGQPLDAQGTPYSLMENIDRVRVVVSE